MQVGGWDGVLAGLWLTVDSLLQIRIRLEVRQLESDNQNSGLAEGLLPGTQSMSTGTIPVRMDGQRCEHLGQVCRHGLSSLSTKKPVGPFPHLQLQESTRRNSDYG